MADYLEDVGSDSSPDEENVDTDFEQFEDEPEAEETDADQDSEGEEESEEKEKPGRTIDNVYHELSRKQEEFQRRVLEQQQMLIEKLAERQTAEPEKKTGNTLDDMSVPELENLRSQVAENNPDKLGEFDTYLNKRRVDAQVESRMSDWEKRQSVEQMRGQARQDALRRYPDLANRGGEFYQAVNARLNQLGDSYVQSNPRAVLDAANDVAAEQGIAPRAASRAANIRGRVGRKANANPSKKQSQKSEEKGMSDKDMDQIGGRLKGALPKGKSFDKKSVQDRAKFYRNNLQYYLRG